MKITNVELSKNELELVCNSEFILTKNRVIAKAYGLFGKLSENYTHQLSFYAGDLPPEILAATPKIYKGENYLGLPYVLLDHPRLFVKDDAFAIRSFLWWGNFFSITLHLSGSYWQRFRLTIKDRLNEKACYNYFIGIGETQWEHHFEKTNYAAESEISIDAVLDRPFFKIAKKLPVAQWQQAPAFFEETYGEILGLLRGH